jgi:hypothetical protein
MGGVVGPAVRAGLFRRFLGRLRFPQLFVAFLILLGVDLVVPDLVPFADELGLALITMLLGAWKRRRSPSEPGHP